MMTSERIEKVERRESDRYKLDGYTFQLPTMAYMPAYGSAKRPRPFVAEALLHNSLWDTVLSYQVGDLL